MVARARVITRRQMLILVAALLGLLVLALRWNALQQPPPTTHDLFPYGELRVGIDASYPPFANTGPDGLYGLEVDLAVALAERLGIPVRFVNLGYDGLYDALRVDQVDVLISMLLIDPARRDDVLYTRPYFNAGLVLVSRADSGINSMDALPGRALAYEFGSPADAEARRWLRRVLPFETRPYELGRYALDAVRLEQADAALVDAITAQLYLNEHPDWDATLHYVTDTWYAAATRADRGPTWEAINQALEALAQDGTLDRIIDRWL
ncbi:MAG: ABC transporter substrate-binding protein [Chloroflexota bacterium]